MQRDNWRRDSSSQERIEFDLDNEGLEPLPEDFDDEVLEDLELAIFFKFMKAFYAILWLWFDIQIPCAFVLGTVVAITVLGKRHRIAEAIGEAHQRWMLG